MRAKALEPQFIIEQQLAQIAQANSADGEGVAKALGLSWTFEREIATLLVRLCPLLAIQCTKLVSNL